MIHLDFKDRYAIVTFDRPEAMNALNSDVILELSKIIDEVEKKKMHALIFTGKGNSFIAGADIKEMMPLRGDEIRAFSVQGRDLFRRIEQLPLVTIAAINGYALGGGLELALACHIRLASNTAKMGFPEVGLGVVPGFSGTQRLPRAIGKMQAIRLMTTGEIIGSNEAKEIGLICELFPGKDLLKEAESLAGKITHNSREAIAKVLLAIDIGLDLPLDHSLEIETGIMTSIFGSPDQIEGMSAFIEKRKPKFE